MCILCIEWELGKLTPGEAFRAIREIIDTTKDEAQASHLIDLGERIIQKDVPLVDRDTELEKDWQKNNSEDK
jgi:hypothetical protein